jgi:predicted kinase
MVGLPGAGKTTLAKQMEAERKALRLTPDEWMRALDIDLFDEPMRAKIEALQWGLAARALKLGLDAILDFGFWSREEREDFAARAKQIGAEAQICFLDVSIEELRHRVQARNEGSAVRIEMDQLESFAAMFQPPTKEEIERLTNP